MSNTLKPVVKVTKIRSDSLLLVDSKKRIEIDALFLNMVNASANRRCKITDVMNQASVERVGCRKM